jgi:hypothetical protein
MVRIGIILGSTRPNRNGEQVALPSIDDFAFTGPGDTLLAVQNQLNQADLITPGGRPVHAVRRRRARPYRVRDKRRVLHRGGSQSAGGPVRRLSHHGAYGRGSRSSRAHRAPEERSLTPSLA